MPIADDPVLYKSFLSARECYQRGDLAGAEAICSRLLALDPSDVELLFLFGNVQMRKGATEAGLECLRLAQQLKPSYPRIRFAIGLALQKIGRRQEAAEAYRAALALDPNFMDANTNLCILLMNEGKYSEALALAQTMTQRVPGYGYGWLLLGMAVKLTGANKDALAPMQKAVAMLPDNADAHNNLGNVLRDLNRQDEAEASFRRALELQPNKAEAHSNLGNILKDLGNLDEAEACYRRALELKPDYADAFDNLLFILNYHPDRRAEEIFAAYREYDERFGLPCRQKWHPHSNSRETGRRLKVGYVSPDFRHHSVRHFLEPLLAHHDKNVVEVYTYAELNRPDAVTKRYQSYVDHWVRTQGMSDDALAECIRADGIDILVDLAGHTTNNRLLVFARKPAPVSFSWLGYGYTTGLSAIDYFLTDSAGVPEGYEGLFSEAPWRLNTPGYAYRPAEGMGSVSALPAAERGYVTFGTLTRAVRINHRTIRVWSEILKRVEGARLVVDSRNFESAAMQDNLAERFAAQGIGRERLEIGCHSPPWDVLRGMDIGLDCFPHNSGTTLFESLYMGVPLVTLAARPSVGRLCCSLLEGVGHPEWIARSEEEYVDIAATLASDVQKLATLRGRLRSEMENSPLMDEPAFARKVESAYREMWMKWCGNG